MSKKRVLITGVGGDIGQSIVKCLNDIGYEFDLLGCDINPYAAGRNCVRKFFVAPMAIETKKYSKFIESVIAEHKLEYIYPTTEAEIVFFNNNRNYFNKKGIWVFINNSFVIDTFFDKYKTTQFLKEKGLPHPVTFLIEDYNNQLSYPLIIKPRKGCGSKEIIKIDNEEEFSFYKKRICNAVVQECVGDEDEEYTTGVFSDGERTCSITFKRELGFSGISKTVKLVIDDRISELAERIAGYSNITGSINIQARKTPKGFIVFEINPRFSSTVYFRHYFGFQDVRWWLDLKENKKIEFRLKYKKGVGVRTLTEVFFDIE